MERFAQIFFQKNDHLYVCILFHILYHDDDVYGR